MTGESGRTEIDYDGSDLEALLTLKRYRRWIFELMTPWLGGVAAEVGAGIGSFSSMVSGKVDSLDLIEPSRALQEQLRNSVAGVLRVRILDVSAEEWLQNSPMNHYDSVVMINVLEHIRDDAAILKNIFDVLKPDGRLIVLVPALQALFCDLDARFGHFRRYEREPLRHLFEDAGFRIANIRFFDVLGILPWLVINKWMGKTSFHPGLLTLYDLVGVTMTRTFETFFVPPIGKNLFVVAIKQRT